MKKTCEVKNMKTGMNSIRVADTLWLDNGRFGRLLDLLDRYPGDIKQVSLFTAGTHVPLPLDEMRRRCDIIKDRMTEAKKRGFSVGINCLGTIGHHEENLGHSLSGYRYMANIDGVTGRGTFCMNDSRFLEEYVVPLYRMMADAAPDYIWIDDDIRFGHMPIGYGCFCDECIHIFNELNGTSYDRTSLHKALNSGNTELKIKWLRHNTMSICRLMKTIRKAVDSVNPGITLGFMTGERYIEGYDFESISEALSDNGKHKIMWRPGGGAYTDYCFDEIISKAEQIGRQNAYLPEYVTVRQSEIENFAYEMLKKSPKSTALEAAWHMSAGCTGAAFNILPSETNEPIELISGHLKTINDYVPLYRLLEEKLHGAQPCGIHTGWTKDSQAAVPAGTEFASSSGSMYADYSREIFDFGLPECYDINKACVVMMHNEAPSVMRRDLLCSLLGKGVFLDTGALDILNGMGFEDYTGFVKGNVIFPDARERYVSSVYDEQVIGGIRNARQAFHPGDSFALIPKSNSCRILSETVDYQENILAGCSMGIYENELGGRVCVSGYYPYTYISDTFKTAQLKNVMVYLSKGTLPSFVDTYCRIRNHTFVSDKGVTLALCNPGNQDLENVTVAIRTDRREAKIYDISAAAVKCVSSGYKDFDGARYNMFTVGRIDAFGIVLIEV